MKLFVEFETPDVAYTSVIFDLDESYDAVWLVHGYLPFEVCHVTPLLTHQRPVNF